MNRLSRRKRIKINNEYSPSEKKESFPVHGSKRKLVVDSSKNNKENHVQNNTVKKEPEKDKKQQVSFNKKGRMKFSKSISSNISPEEDHTSFFDTNSLNGNYNESFEEDNSSTENAVYEKKKQPEDDNKELNEAKNNTPSFKSKKRSRLHIKDKNIIEDNGKFKKPMFVDDNVEKKEEESQVYNTTDSGELKTRPTARGIKRTKNKDLEIIIRPYSSFEPENGVYRKETHQETSNIRFTESDRIFAEESGLSWD